MSKDQILGWTILLGSIGGIAAYFYLVFLSPWTMFIIQLSAFLAVAVILLTVAWIGYTMATIPPPAPLEDFNYEEDISVDEREESSKEE